MPALNRRPNRDSHREGWFIYYGDVQIGHIGKRAGVPVSVNQWGWHCGFQPAAQRGVAAAGTAPNFDQARNAFERAWQKILPRCTEDDFTSFRRQRAATAWKYKMWESNSKMPTQSAEGRSTCYCGVPITIANMDSHIYAAHLAEEEQATT
jgi:hypothetical protein